MTGLVNKMGKLFITGANGFVGKHLIQELSQLGTCEIYAASRAKSKNKLAVTPWPAPDLEISEQWKDLPEGIDTIVHLASRAHVMGEKGSDAEQAYYNVNVEGTRSLMKAAGRSKAKHLIYISSIKAVGESSEHGKPLTEESPLMPEDAYGISKAQTEALIQEEAAKMGLTWTIIRPPLLYGPGMKGNLPSLAKLVGKGFPLPFGAIRENRRSLLGIDNLISFILFCLANQETTKNQIFHLADPTPVSTRELIELLAKAQDLTPKLLPVPPVLLNICLKMLGKKSLARRLLGSLEVSSAKIEQLCHWTPPISTESSLPKAFS